MAARGNRQEDWAEYHYQRLLRVGAARRCQNRCKRHRYQPAAYPLGFAPYTAAGETRQGRIEKCTRCGKQGLRDCTTGRIVYR